MNKKGNNTNRDVNLENNKEKQKFKISKSDLKILIFSVFGVVIGFALGYLIFYNEGTALFGRDSYDGNGNISEGVEESYYDENGNISEGEESYDSDEDYIFSWDDLELIDNVIDFSNLKEYDEFNISRSYLINSSNSVFLENNEFVGAMFQTNISNEYKVAFSLNVFAAYLFNSFDENNDYYYSSNETFTAFFKISEDKLKDVIKLYFADYDFDLEKLEFNVEDSSSTTYNSFNNITCENGICNVSLVFGLGGMGMYDGYETIISEKGDTQLVAKIIYIDYPTDTYGKNEKADDDSIGIDLYDMKDGNLVKTLTYSSIDDFYSSSSDVVSKYSKKTFTYTFNSDDQLVSVVAG